MGTWLWRFDRASVGRIATWAIGASYAALCLLVVAPLHPTEVEIDSHKYLEGEIFDPRRPGILTTALYSVLDPPWISHVHMAIAVVAWLILALGVQRYVRGRLGMILGALVLCYSLATPVMSWQWLAMTDGLTMSIFVASLGCLLLLLESDRSPGKVWLYVGGPLSLVALVRPTLLVVTLPLSCLLVVWLRPRARSPERFGYVAAVGAITGWGAWRLWTLNALDRERVWYAQNILATRPDYYERAQPYIENCAELSATVRSIQEQTPGHIPEVLSPTRCPEAYAWLSSTSASPWSWIADRPLPAIHDFAHALYHSELTVYSKQVPTLPRRLSELLLPSGYTVFRISVVYLLVGVALLMCSSRRVRWTHRRAVAAVVAAIGMSAYLFVTWFSDGIEEPRHMMPVTTLLPIALMLAPIVLLGGREHDAVRTVVDAELEQSH